MTIRTTYEPPQVSAQQLLEMIEEQIAQAEAVG